MTVKTVAEKLLVREGASLWVSDPARVGLLGHLPGGAVVVSHPDGASVAVVVADGAADVRAALAAHVDALTRSPAFWVAYPKGGRADINRDSLWPLLAGHGFRPIGQVALDETWSALRFRPLRAGEPPFGGGR